MHFPVPWGQMAAQEWGDFRSPKKWLAVHGWLDNSNSWAYLGPLLADRGEHVVAIELPGHGLSDWLPQGLMYHDLEFVACLYRTIRQLGWNRFGLIGHSLGGGLCLTYAATFPEQICTLIMLDITFLPIRPFTPYEFQARVRTAVKSTIIMEERLATRPPRVLKSKEEARERLMQPPVYLKDLDIRETFTVESANLILQRGLKRVEGGWTFRRDPRLVLPSLFFLDFDDQKNQGRNIRCPHLIIEASKGPKSTFGVSMYDVYRENPQFKLVQLEGLHHIHLNEHQIVNKIIVDFLDAAEAQPPLSRVKSSKL